MKQECAWDNIKHDLRNILVSNKIAMTVNELTYKFKKMTGKPIPFELLGYPDIECFLMDLPDVLNTIWFQGELRLQCKRDPTDIHVEALVNVVKNGKVPNFGGFGKNIPIENQIEIFIPREWQNKIENIIKSIAETGCSISKLESVLIEQCVEIPNERITLVGALRRCWNLKVNVEKTIVYIRYRADVLKIYIDKLLNNFPDGILLDQFEKTFQVLFI
uniref:Tudor domain-containing protein 5 (Trinotate prediction) n=1 Tax=Henneguya salminicola TaxID=69463 RepID=A0A6G3MH30_HENSL